MKSEAKTLLTTPTEQPHHYTYLKEFRVQQCPLFLQHKCTQHRPYTCFDWHFMNQRRRRPVRKRDGTFNYSADNYCTKFDETTGVCPEGDDCPYLHRTAGDTERRYHLRYYKTGMCVHDTDSRGLCVKNGAHCAFSHGTQDLRPPVYDIKEIQALENQDFDSNALCNGPNVLDKERNLMNEDPKWQDTSYVLANYKTEPCKRPPRLCRQGYACPQYHNSRDKRRNPRKIKYRSTPCPSVKHGDEWGEPAQCENGDACQYCHTRTEQQFHPEIYKSTKCHDVQTARYCPRGVFCAFAHVEHEMAAARDLAACSDSGTNLAEILSTALGPASSNDKHGVSGSGGLNSGGCSNNNGGNNSGIPTGGNTTGVIGTGIGIGIGVGICANKDKSSESSNGSGEVSESASTSSLGSNSSHSKAPGAQLSSSSKHNGPSLVSGFSLSRSTQEMLHANLLRKQLEIEKDPMLDSHQKAQRKQCLLQAYSHSPFYTSAVSAADTVESVVGNALDDLILEDPLNLAASLEKDLCGDERSSISAGLASSGIILGSSAPVNIPGSSHVSATVSSNAHLFSSPGSSPIFLVGDGGSRFSHHDCLSSSNFLNQTSSHHHVSSAPKLGGLFDSFTSASPSHSNTSAFPMASGDVQMSRLAEAWRQEADESKRLASIAEKQRDEALAQATALQKEVDLLQGSPYLHALRRVSELSTLSYSTLESLRAQLLNDLREVDKAMYLLQMRSECIVCKTNHHLSMSSCNHYVICNQCATTYRNECSYCATSNSNQGAGVSGQNSGVVVVTSSTSNLIVGGSTTSASTAAAK